jgi:hypothetical protein
VVVTYRTDNKEARILITKIKQSVASWFLGYWTKICKYKHGMIKKLVESFDINAAKLAGYSEFDVETLTVVAKFGYVDMQLDGIEVELGINQGWEADFEEGDCNRVDVIGHREVLGQSLCNRVNDVDNADRSVPSRRRNFSCSKGNSTNNSEATIQQHTMCTKALRNIDLVDKYYALENNLTVFQDQMVSIGGRSQP